MFQKSGLSKFAAATVRLSEQKREADRSHLTASANAKNDVSFTAQAPRGFIVDQEDANNAEAEWASKKMKKVPVGKSEQQDDKQQFLQRQMENTSIEKQTSDDKYSKQYLGQGVYKMPYVSQ